jgi:uncharacterized protein (TIGR00730 family)
MKRICVFCGSRTGARESYATAARAAGTAIAARGLELVYGGGHVGLMGVVADAALAAGGRVIGIIPTLLAKKEVAHERLSELHVVRTMHERKAMMAELSDAFLILPGGVGTLEEFFEIWTWAQIGEHEKPFGLVNVDGFYNGLLAFLDTSVNEGFLRPRHRDLLIHGTDPVGVLDALGGLTG